jgi:hypothetical protein
MTLSKRKDLMIQLSIYFAAIVCVETNTALTLSIVRQFNQ